MSTYTIKVKYSDTCPGTSTKPFGFKLEDIPSNVKLLPNDRLIFENDSTSSWNGHQATVEITGVDGVDPLDIIFVIPASGPLNIARPDLPNAVRVFEKPPVRKSPPRFMREIPFVGKLLTMALNIFPGPNLKTLSLVVDEQVLSRSVKVIENNLRGKELSLGISPSCRDDTDPPRVQVGP